MQPSILLSGSGDLYASLQKPLAHAALPLRADAAESSLKNSSLQLEMGRGGGQMIKKRTSVTSLRATSLPLITALT